MVVPPLYEYFEWFSFNYLFLCDRKGMKPKLPVNQPNPNLNILPGEMEGYIEPLPSFQSMGRNESFKICRTLKVHRQIRLVSLFAGPKATTPFPRHILPIIPTWPMACAPHTLLIPSSRFATNLSPYHISFQYSVEVFEQSSQLIQFSIILSR